MAFDQTTRNRLAKFVSQTRDLLAEEFTRQLQNDYGLDPSTGDETELSKLPHLNDTQRETACLLRETIEHYLAGSDTKGLKGRQETLGRIVREQAFTVLNRLCALRMAESRGLLMESIGQGYNSKGFQLYGQIAGASLGERGDAYRSYLYGLFDEFSIDLPVLFDRYSPQGRLFPREAILLQVLDLINHPGIDELWAEDETIGWIYQYWNSKEERKAMRDASSAPRNSRELAVRNQFFTPRYVVEFLTDNTLGRIWYEMTQGETRLKEQCQYLVKRPNEIFLQPDEDAPEQPDQESLTQEELLQQPVYIPYRPIKDPREIRMLDPACGSMHFGLYAFDLFEVVYEEAWDLGMEALHNDFSCRDAFLRELPRLIIEYNIHGIDIDTRAVQIAGLSLWLRAQKGWHDQSVSAPERPKILRSNIVCAEPMPGSPELLEEFVITLDPPLLGEMIKTVFEKMGIAGEAGSLLKIEEEIRFAIDEAHEAWKKLDSKPRELFSTDELNRISTSSELSPLEKSFTASRQLSTDFWETAEKQVIDALRAYAEKVEAGSYQRRLFADDAARGFAYIDLCRKRYDAVVMNPPFGEFPDLLVKYLKKQFPELSGNILCGFIARADSFLTEGGATACIIDKTATIKSSYSSIRERLLRHTRRLSAMIDLGWGILDGAQVETVALVIDRPISKFINFYQGPNGQLDDLSNSPNQTLDLTHPIIRPASYFINVPNMALAYDLPEELLSLFSETARCEPDIGDARQGLGISDSRRWYRAAWEVPLASSGSGRDYAWLTNGGGFAPFFRDHDLVIFWKDNGASIKATEGHIYGSWSRTVKNVNYYFKRGVSFPKRTEHLNAHLLPEGFIFTVEGLGFFPNQHSENNGKIWEALCLLNSRLEAFIINRFCGQHKHVGYVKSLPAVNQALTVDALSNCQRAVSMKRLWSSRFCNNALFVMPAIFDIAGLAQDLGLVTDVDNKSLRKLFESLCALVKSGNTALQKTQENIDRLVFDAFRITKSTRHLIVSETKSRPICRLTQGLIENDEIGSELWVFEIFDYALGISFGRWDIRYAIGEHQVPELPASFDPLPICPPGMLQNKDGLPAEPKDVPADYPLHISWSGILVDDANHSGDIVNRMRETIEVIWKDRAEAIEREVCEILDMQTIRDYFQKFPGYFANHLKRYSKSRRQAPIYWPLSTLSGKYTLWIYYHRLTNQTLYTVVNDFVEPKVSQVTDEITSLRRVGVRTTQQEKALEELTDFEIELKDFRDELLGIAAFWKPNLNDGVIITASPLWKLFQHKPWQKKLKQTWDKLKKGDYDWAHLALSIWPDRVVRASHKDRSYAIAHDLEDQLWEEVEVEKRGRGGRVTKKIEWRPRELTEDELEAIIEQVKAR